MNITTVVEKKRGCGYREPGGLYLRTDGIGRICGALPIKMDVCPTCKHGIKPARGWTWINIADLVAVRGCDKEGGCGDCPIADAKIQEAGLLWIGAKFYPGTTAFNTESREMGISRRITMVPRGFKIGETWVALAHRNCILAYKDDDSSHWYPGIFHIFRPERVEYVVKEFDPQDKLERLEKRGITLVRVVREQMELEEVKK